MNKQEVLLPMRLRNHTVLPNLFDEVTQNNRSRLDTGFDPNRSPPVLEPQHNTQSKGQITSPSVTSANNSELQNALISLMEQNKILMTRLMQNENNIHVPANTFNNGYYVMPDFNHSLTTFSRRKSSTEARAWLSSVESVARLHNWPDSFKLETVRT